MTLKLHPRFVNYSALVNSLAEATGIIPSAVIERANKVDAERSKQREHLASLRNLRHGKQGNGTPV